MRRVGAARVVWMNERISASVREPLAVASSQPRLLEWSTTAIGTQTDYRLDVAWRQPQLSVRRSERAAPRRHPDSPPRALI
jgi:hypothetical protein